MVQQGMMASKEQQKAGSAVHDRSGTESAGIATTTLIFGSHSIEVGAVRLQTLPVTRIVALLWHGGGGKQRQEPNLHSVSWLLAADLHGENLASRTEAGRSGDEQAVRSVRHNQQMLRW